MNKFKKISVLSVLAISTLFVSCDEDDATGASTVMATPSVSGDITVPFTGVQNVNEADEDTFTFSVTIDKPQVSDVHLRVSQTGGSAHAGDDFEIPAEIVIPAYATTASGTVKILNDAEVEGVEDFTVQIGDVATSNAGIATKTLSFTINNAASDELNLTFNFNHAFSIAGTDYTLCQIGYDMDFYVLDAALVDTGLYGAATAACPEHLDLAIGDLPDGEYHIYYDIFDDGGISTVYHDPFDIPITVDYSRDGVIAPGTFTQEAAYIPNSTDGTGSDYVITIEINAGVFTLKNSVPEVIASGRADRVKNAIRTARRNNNK